MTARSPRSSSTHSERTAVPPSHIRVRLDFGALAVLIALAGFGVFDWPAVLLGWGVMCVILALLDLREWSRG